MKRTRRALLVILILAVVLPALTILVPVPEGFSDMDGGNTPASFRFILIGATFFAWLYIGAAILFFMGLDAFKAELRRTFRLICFGLISTGIALVTFPVAIVLSSVRDSIDGQDWTGLPYAIAAVALYIGIRSFAKVLGIKNILTQAIPILVATLLLALLSGFVFDTDHRIQLISDSWNFMLESVSLVLVILIKRAAGPAYTNALAWFILALACGVISLAVPTITLASGNDTQPWVVVPVAVAAGLFLKTGYVFNKIKEY